MNEELNAKLCAKYPKIFEHWKHMECMDGWYWLINNLCHSIQWRCDQEVRTYEEVLARNEMVQKLQSGDDSLFVTRYKGMNPEYVATCKADYIATGIIKPVIPNQVYAAQVKEKFGGLRFYTGPASDGIHSIISFAEALSYHICEVCGTTVRVGRTEDGWIFTCCEDCCHKKWPERGWRFDAEEGSNDAIEEMGQELIKELDETK